MANVSIIKFLDKLLGSLISLILAIFSRKKQLDAKNAKRILIIQLWGIGETILTLPAVSAVRKRFKNSELSVLATERNKEAYLSSGIKLNVLSLSMDPISILWFIIANLRRFDMVIDLEEYLNISSIISFFIGRQRIGFSGRPRSSLYHNSVKYNANQHTVQAFLDLARLLRADYKKKIPKLNYGNKEKALIKGILKQAPKKAKIIGIVPGAAESAKSRMWPLQRYARLANRLLKKNVFLIFMGTKSEKPLIDDIITVIDDKSRVFDTAGLISIKELFCLVDNLNLLITNDTGPLHIASAQGTKVIGLFGPNLPTRFGPYRTKGSSIYHKSSCKFSPCINVHKGQVPDCLYAKRSKDYQKCMKAITVDEVLKAANSLL
jgi:heptosyltransferase-2